MEGMKSNNSPKRAEKAEVRRLGNHFYWSVRSSDVQNDIDSHANFEGNNTILLLARLRHPQIRKQLVDLFVSAESAPGGHGRARQDVEKELEANFERVGLDTPISFNAENMPDAGERELMCPNWRGFEILTGKPPTTRILSIVEAHEKGHVIRPFHSSFFDTHFARGFDPQAATFSDDDYEKWRRLPGMPPLSREEFDVKMKKYLFSAPEIAKRMSQLKNYFGMRGNEIITKEHLEYARKHYIVDTGFDNDITQFLQAVTAETESRFLELINTSGI